MRFIMKNTLTKYIFKTQKRNKNKFFFSKQKKN